MTNSSLPQLDEPMLLEGPDDFRKMGRDQPLEFGVADIIMITLIPHLRSSAATR